MHVGIAQSRWALRVQCVRSAWEIFCRGVGESRNAGAVAGWQQPG